MGCGSPKGATEEEVAELEEALGCKLPEAYRIYLLWIGRNYNGRFVGTDCFIDDVLANNENLPDLLSTNGVEFELPSQYVCFYLHQGYFAAWFELPAVSPDPPCWYFGEGTTQTPVQGESFSSFMDLSLPSLEQLEERRRRRCPPEPWWDRLARWLD